MSWSTCLLKLTLLILCKGIKTLHYLTLLYMCYIYISLLTRENMEPRALCIKLPLLAHKCVLKGFPQKQVARLIYLIYPATHIEHRLCFGLSETGLNSKTSWAQTLLHPWHVSCWSALKQGTQPLSVHLKHFNSGICILDMSWKANIFANIGQPNISQK